jgi:hypothetical protein
MTLKEAVEAGFTQLQEEKGFFELKPGMERVEALGEGVARGFRAGGMLGVKQIAGLAQMIVEHPISPALALTSPLWKQQVLDWGKMTADAVDQHFKENPEDNLSLQKEGLLPILGELITNPQKMVQGIMTSVPLMAEGILGTMVAGPMGGIAAMGVPISGEVYSESRKEGDSPHTALARSLLTGFGEAAIEQWTLGKKLGLSQQILSRQSRWPLRKVVWEGTKAFFRGMGEEGSQEFNRNFWRWVFTDRSQRLSEGVVESMAVGGPLELAMAGGFASISYLGTPHSVSKQLKSLDKIRQQAVKDKTLTPEQTEEIQIEIDKIQEVITGEFIELTRERYPQEITDDRSLAEVGNQIAQDFGIDIPIEWRLVKTNNRHGNWGLHTKFGNKTKSDRVTIYQRPGHNTQQAMKETLVHELGHIASPPRVNKKPPLTRLPKGFKVAEVSPGKWMVRKTTGIDYHFKPGNTRQEAIDNALEWVNYQRQYPRRNVHHKEFEQWVKEHETKLGEAVQLSAPGRTYNEAISKRVVNPWIRNTDAKSNKGRWLAVQFSDTVTIEEDESAKRYYDKLYGTRKGYKRMGDFWEVPLWMTHLPRDKTDTYVVRDVEEAKAFLQNAGYDAVLFSVMDSNQKQVKDLLDTYAGKVIMGGYGDGPSQFQDMPNVSVYHSMDEMAKKEENAVFAGQSHYSNFEDSDTIPRLCMSKGCLHECKFCTVPKGITEMTESEIRSNAKEIAEKLKPELVYLNDKTFGQAKNHKLLPEIYKIFKKGNDNFQGFIIQTTASQFNKMDNKFIKDSGIKYVEIGVESYNDDILKAVKKPASEKTIQQAADKIRKLGSVSLIPNIIVGMPQETADTYARTLQWLQANADVISHLNIYNLALHGGSELAAELKAEEGVDLNENQVRKSFHENPEVHENAAEAFYALGEALLDKPAPADIESDVVESNRRVSEYREAAKVSRKKLLALGHKIPTLMKLSDAERRGIMKDLTGKTSMKDMDMDEMTKVVDYFKEQYDGDITLSEEDMDVPVILNHQATTMGKVMNQVVEATTNLKGKLVPPKDVTKKYRNKVRRTLKDSSVDFLVGIDNSNIGTLAFMLGEGKDSIFTDIFRDNILNGVRGEAAHIFHTLKHLQDTLKINGVTDEDLARMSRSANPRFKLIDFLPVHGTIGVDTEILTVSIGDKNYEMTWGELIDIYLAADQSREMKIPGEEGDVDEIRDGERHLLNGGALVNFIETGAFSEEDLQNIRDMVEANPKAMAVIRTIQSIDELYWKPAINQVSMNLKGKAIATTDRWWGLDVNYERGLPGKDYKFNVNLIEDKGILKDRTMSDRPIIISDAFDRFTKFENAIAEYFAMSEPLRLARTVLNHQDIRNQLKQKGYSKVIGNIEEILKRAQSVSAPEGIFGSLLRKGLHGAYAAVLFTNLRVVASQYTSTAVYEAFADKSYLLSAIKDGASIEAMKQTLELSPVAWRRFYMGRGTMELGELVANDATLSAFSKKSSWRNKLAYGIKATDLAALTVGLQVAINEYKAAQAGNIKGKSAEWWADRRVDFEEGTESWRQAVADRAEWLWMQTQPSWDKWFRSVNIGEPSITKKVFTGMLFRSFHEKALNVTQQAYVEYQNSAKTNEDKVKFADKTGAVITSYTINVLVRGLIASALGWKMKKPIEWLINLLTGPLSMIPFIGRNLQDILGNFTRVYSGESPKFTGKLFEPLPVTVANNISNATGNFANGAAFYLRGDTEQAERAFEKGLKQATEGAGLLAGVPVYEIRRIQRAVTDEETSGRGRRGGRRTRGGR